MARKNVIEGLMSGAGTPAPQPAQPRRKAGAIGAVSQSLAELRGRALVEVPADMIDDAGLTDRLDEDPAGMAELVRSIEVYGQQVPVMLRHSPNYEGRYEVVFGRRRVQALKALKQPVRAMLRDLPDRELIIAQGQENAARKDLSFIEKANFARQMSEMKFDRKTICDALHIDKTVVSRMLQVAEAIPPALVRAIGAAPAAGRDRWLALAKRIDDRPEKALVALADGSDSDARFPAVFEALAPDRSPPAPPRAIVADDGSPLAEVVRRGDRTTLTLTGRDGFADWLESRLAQLHDEFRRDG